MSYPFSESGGQLYSMPQQADAGLAAILAAISDAQKTIHLEMFNLSHPALCQALGAAAKRGVTLDIIIDNSQEAGTSGVRGLHLMLSSGVPIEAITISTSEVLHAFDHKKDCICDATTIVSGSTNWTLSAFNERNTLVIFDDPDLAAALIADHLTHKAWARANELKYQQRV